MPVHFSHNEPAPVQISLQYLHWCQNYLKNAGFGSEWDTLYLNKRSKNGKNTEQISLLFQASLQHGSSFGWLKLNFYLE
jgi:hypothetical protein